MAFLNSLVKVGRRFQRSVNIGEDAKENDGLLDGYQLQHSAVNVLSIISEHLLETAQKAFTITGPFGAGKSSLGLYLYLLANGRDQRQRDALKKLLPWTEYERIRQSFVCPDYEVRVVTGRKGDFLKDLNLTLFEDPNDTLLNNLKKLRTTGEKKILVILDEMGRYLSEDQFENCAEFQDFAEAINRKDSNIVFIGILHQNFTSYGQMAPEYQKLEWQKVQGRFVDAPLIAHSEETLQMLSAALQLTCPSSGNREYSEKAIDLAVHYLSGIRRINEKKYKEIFRKTWPLNPVVSLILGPLSRRGFWQNTRSVFNFLTSLEPSGFQEFLSTNEEGSPALYGPHNLWDYLDENYGLLISSDPVERRSWSVAQDCLFRAEGLGLPLAAEVVKTVALLNLFSAGSGLKPSFEIICASFPEASSEDLLSVLKALQQKKIVIEKRHVGTFSLFEGSDFDFEKKYESLSITEIDPVAVNALVSFPIFVARRHYVTTGNLRWFECQVTNNQKLAEDLEGKKFEGTGKLLLWLGSENEKELQELCQKVGVDDERLNLIAIPEKKEDILAMCIEVQKINNILQDPGLEGDRAARIEVESMLTFAKDRLNSLLIDSLDHARWLVIGESWKTVNGVTNLTKYLSDLCDSRYRFSLCLKNELVNREELSSNIKSARKTLMSNMVTKEDCADLGMTGMPPERMIYLSFFKTFGLHQQKTEGGDFEFVLPSSATSLNEIWKRTQDFLSSKEKVEVAQVYELWKKTPFGIKTGFAPILLLYFYCLNKTHLTFFLEGAYQPELTVELVELLVNRPELFQLRLYAANDVDSRMNSELYDYLVSTHEKPLDHSPLSVARSLVKKVFLQPRWVLSTSRASTQSKKFCETILKASDPIKLLFNSLPEVLGTTTSNSYKEKIVERFQELEMLISELSEEIRDFLLRELDAQNETEVQTRANALKQRSGDLQLEGFINVVSSLKGKGVEGPLAVLSFVTGKQKGRWTDLDLLKAKTSIAELAFKFRHLEALLPLGEEKNRRLLGIVEAGVSGRKEWVINVPVDKIGASTELRGKIYDLLKGLSKEEQLAVLVDSIYGVGEGKS